MILIFSSHCSVKRVCGAVLYTGIVSQTVEGISLFSLCKYIFNKNLVRCVSVRLNTDYRLLLIFVFENKVQN